MGKQLEFYMTPVDEESFANTMFATGNIAIVLAYFPTPDLVDIDAAVIRDTDNCDDYGQLCIINKDIDPKLIIGPAGPDRFSLSRSQSEVIEFSRWTIIRNDGKKEPGRLWYDHEDINCRPKRKAFLTWAQSVFRYIKKHYRRSDEHYGRYFGPDAWEKYQEGTLILAPF